MTSPDQALAAARAAAAEMRAAGAYADVEPSPPGPPSLRGIRQRLFDWAIIEPDASQVRSLRPYGAPITALKRLLLRLLVQYHVQMLGDQTRFNVMLLAYTRELEQRVADLEAQTSSFMRDRPERDRERRPGEPT